MSRGRGAAYRGRGGSGFVKREKIGGQEESWDHNPNFVIDTKSREFYPEIQIPKPPPPSRLERAQFRHFQEFRRRVRDGPLYTVLDDHAKIGKSAPKRAANFNPFEDMPTYTQKYKPPSKALPRFDTRAYDLSLFPKELWDVVAPKRSKRGTGTAASVRVARGRLSRDAAKQRPNTEVEDEDQRHQQGADDEDEMVTADDDAVVSESNPEDDFEDNDSEMAADYNAEMYFDAGEDDGDGLDGDGGDDGGFD